MKPSQLIGRYVRGQIAMSRLTQRQVAAELDMTQQALSRRLTGQTPFSIDELSAVVRFLGIDYADMVGEVGRMRSREARKGKG